MTRKRPPTAVSPIPAPAGWSRIEDTGHLLGHHLKTLATDPSAHQARRSIKTDCADHRLTGQHLETRRRCDGGPGGTRTRDPRLAKAVFSTELPAPGAQSLADRWPRPESARDRDPRRGGVAVLGDLASAIAIGLGMGAVLARNPSTIRLYIENPAAIRTASCTSASVASASRAAAASASVSSRASPRTTRATCSSARILASSPSEDPILMVVQQRRKLGLSASLEQRVGVRAVRVHAEEAVVRRGHSPLRSSPAADVSAWRPGSR